MEKKNENLIFVLTIPRSLSTIFMRILSQCPNTEIFQDKLMAIHIFEVYIKKSKESFENLAKSFEDEIEKKLKENKKVVVKDMGSFINHYHPEYIDKLIKKFNPKIVYLVRHPVPCHSSFKKMMDRERELGNAPEEDIKRDERFNPHKPLWDLYQKHNGFVLITEDFQEHPEETLAKVYSFMGLQFKNEMLSFQPWKDTFPNQEELKSMEHFYSDCINSTEFKSSKLDLSKYSLNEDWEKEKIKDSMTFYENFVKESKNNY